MWIEPRNSKIVQIRAAEIVVSDKCVAIFFLGGWLIFCVLQVQVWLYTEVSSIRLCQR